MANNAKIMNPQNGKFPKWCNTKRYSGKQDVFTKALFLLLKEFTKDELYKHINKCLRELLNKLYGCFEREDGFYYGITEGVNNLIKSGNINNKEMIVEHAIPVNILIEKMIEQIRDKKVKNPEELKMFHKDHYYICLITQKEDHKLNSNRLKQKIPDGWIDITDWKARYNFAGIELVSLPGKISK